MIPMCEAADQSGHTHGATTTELWTHKVCVDSAVHTALVEDGGTTQIFRLAEVLSSLQFHMYVV